MTGEVRVRSYDQEKPLWGGDSWAEGVHRWRCCRQRDHQEQRPCGETAWLVPAMGASSVAGETR